MGRRRSASAEEESLAGGASAARRGRRRTRSRPGGIAAVLTFVLAFADATNAGAGVLEPGLFGTREIHSESLLAFPKWREALQRFDRQLASCAAPDCRLEDWRRLLAQVRAGDVRGRLARLNRLVNRHDYVEDWVNWRRADYWATPLQFLDRSGDCEDFAIAKYLALRALGMEPDAMRIVVLHDRGRGRKHAVLAVYVEGRAFILDNLRDAVVAADEIGGYEPIYSINERGWWLHRR
jgi:predicted transglutaminase-like cysteine proteinase